MSMRNIFLGNEQGDTAWQKFKGKWKQSRDAEKVNSELKKAYNPLKVRPGDIVELGLVDKSSYEIETLVWYQTAEGDPDYIRYALKDLQTSKLSLLEVMDDTEMGGLTYAIFQLKDEFDLDEKLIDVIENEDFLQHAVVSDSGEETVCDYAKDFIAEATIHLITKTDFSSYQVTSANYFLEHENQAETYLTIEVIEENEWMSIYEGKKIKSVEVSAIGSL